MKRLLPSLLSVVLGLLLMSWVINTDPGLHAQAPFPNTSGTGSGGGGGGGGITQLTADVLAGPGSGSQAAALSTTGATAGTYGDSTHVGQFTVDAKGRISAASNVAISGGSSGDWVKLLGQTASSSASLDFATVFSANPSYKRYVVVIDNYVPSVNIALTYMLFSTNGSTFDTAAHYSWVAQRWSLGGTAGAGANPVAFFDISASGGNSNVATNGGGCHEVWIHQPATGTSHPRIDWRGSNNDGTANQDVNVIGGGTYNITTAVTGFQIKPDSGVITSGIVTAYGVN